MNLWNNVYCIVVVFCVFMVVVGGFKFRWYDVVKIFILVFIVLDIGNELIIIGCI